MEGVEIDDRIARETGAGRDPDFETIQLPSVVEPRQIPPEPPIPQHNDSDMQEEPEAVEDGGGAVPELADASTASARKTLVLRAAGDTDEQADGQDESSSSESGESEAVEPTERMESPDDVPQEIQTHRVVEAVLFAADAPLPSAKIAGVLGVGDARDVRKHIERLNQEYAAHGLSFRVEHVAGGYQMLTLPAYNTWLRKLLRARRETRLSSAALETLAVVAYKQPCTRAEIEAVRGVAAGDLLNRLREMNLVKIVGRAEDLGRPLLYGTTRHFLEVFGLPSLEDLPQVEALAQPNGSAASRADRVARSAETQAPTSRSEAVSGQVIPLEEPSTRPATEDDRETPDERVASDAPAAQEAADAPIEQDAPAPPSE